MVSKKIHAKSLIFNYLQSNNWIFHIHGVMCCMLDAKRSRLTDPMLDMPSKKRALLGTICGLNNCLQNAI